MAAGGSPAYTQASGSASRTTQASVLPAAAGPSSRRACSSVGWTWTERGWRASRNLSNSGNRPPGARARPSRRSGILAISSRRVAPARGPPATTLGRPGQSDRTQASPVGSRAGGAPNRSRSRLPPHRAGWKIGWNRRGGRGSIGGCVLGPVAGRGVPILAHAPAPVARYLPPKAEVRWASSGTRSRCSRPVGRPEPRAGLPPPVDRGSTRGPAVSPDPGSEWIGPAGSMPPPRICRRPGLFP